jgi:hypothetical protein
MCLKVRLESGPSLSPVVCGRMPSGCKITQLLDATFADCPERLKKPKALVPPAYVSASQLRMFAKKFRGLNPQTLESSLGFAYSFVLSARRRAKSVARASYFGRGLRRGAIFPHPSEAAHAVQSSSQAHLDSCHSADVTFSAGRSNRRAGPDFGGFKIHSQGTKERRSFLEPVQKTGAQYDTLVVGLSVELRAYG